MLDIRNGSDSFKDLLGKILKNNFVLILAIFSEEFVFCAIMRHKIDTTNFFAINLAQQNPRTGSALSKAPVTPIQKNSIVSSSQVKA